MSRYVVDSYAWVEYLGGSPKGSRVEELLGGAEESWTPTPVLAEVTSKVVRSGKDPAIKNFAQSTLPTLQEHLKLAEQITPKEDTRASK